MMLFRGLCQQAMLGDAPKLTQWNKDQYWCQISQTVPDQALEEAFQHMEKALALVSTSLPPESSDRPATSTTALSRHLPPLRRRQRRRRRHKSLLGSFASRTLVTWTPKQFSLLPTAQDDIIAILDGLEKNDTPWRPSSRSWPTPPAGLDWAIHYRDELGQTALHIAADRGCQRAVSWLLEYGADLHAADHDGISVLQAAVIAGNVAICQTLLRYGANPDQPDRDGDTARLCAMDDDCRHLRNLFWDFDDDNNNHGVAPVRNVYCHNKYYNQYNRNAKKGGQAPALWFEAHGDSGMDNNMTQNHGNHNGDDGVSDISCDFTESHNNNNNNNKSLVNGGGDDGMPSTTR